MSIMTKVTYINDEGTKIFLTYGPAVSGGLVGFDNERKDYAELSINGNKAYLFRANVQDDRNNLLWVDKDNNITFKLMSGIDTSELIRIAEGIREIES